MKTAYENSTNVLKRRKLNFFQRFSHRISRYFHRGKAERGARQDCGLTGNSLSELPVTSKSHDDLRPKERLKGIGKKNSNALNTSLWETFKRLQLFNKGIPKTNNRCLSEGDLTQEEGPFYSEGSSPKVCTSKTYESDTNTSSINETNVERAFSHKNGHSFKNELALKLRAKNPVKDNDSEHSKTPDSPPGPGAGTSPSRQGEHELRTPRSMSSLSQSSNSLLSGTLATNYGLSDGESMSRSMIDSSDDIGIVVDLTTPICKTTTASLLDSTAARQKIAASKARRARPKALGNMGDKVSQSDGLQFSPVRDKRDILEEISEEDCLQIPHSPEVPDDPSRLSAKRPLSYPSKSAHDHEGVSAISKRLSNQSDSSIGDLPGPSGTGDSCKTEKTKAEDVLLIKEKSPSVTRKTEDLLFTKEKLFSVHNKVGDICLGKESRPEETHLRSPTKTDEISLKKEKLLSSSTKFADVSLSKERTQSQTIRVDETKKENSVTFAEKVLPSKTGDGFPTHLKSLSESGDTKGGIKCSSDTEDLSSFKERTHLKSFSGAGDTILSKEKISLKQTLEMGDVHGINEKPQTTSTDNDEIKLRFSQNKSKFQFDTEKSEPIPKFYVKLRPVGNLVTNPDKSKVEKEESEVPVVFSKDSNSHPSKDKEPSPDSVNINRYVPLRPSRVNTTRPVTTAECALPTTAAKESLAGSNLAVTLADKRASKVLDMVKNLEGVSCSDSL